MATGSAASRSRRSSSKSSSGKKLVRNKNTPSLKSQGAGYSTTNRKGETTFYKSSKDAAGYSDRGGTRSTQSKGTPLSKFDSSGNAITATALAPSTPLKIPTKDQVTGVPDIAALNQGFTDPVTGVTADPSGKLAVAPVDATGGAAADKYAGLVKMFDTYQKGIQNIQPPNTEDIYTKQYKADGIAKKQQAVNDYTAQLNTIVANRDANVLKLEGQGRGITDVIIGGQQAQVNKEAAIAALPVQAQLAAAQGNLEMAQNHLDTMFKIKSQDAINQYNYKTKLLDSVYNFVSGIAQAKIADLKAAEERKYQESQDFLKTQQAALANALGQEAPASIYNAIKNATTKNDVIIAAGIYNGDILARQAQKANIAQSQAAAANSYDSIRSRRAGEAAAALAARTSSNQTEGQRTANYYADRMKQAEGVISAIGNNFTKAYSFGGALPNLLQSSQRQQYEQAKRNFVNAVLRKESGAVIADSEFASASTQYFPQAGDSPEVVAQKAQNRATSLSGMYNQANIATGGNIVTAPNGVQIELID